MKIHFLFFNLSPTSRANPSLDFNRVRDRLKPGGWRGARPTPPLSPREPSLLDGASGLAGRSKSRSRRITDDCIGNAVITKAARVGGDRVGLGGIVRASRVNRIAVTRLGAGEGFIQQAGADQTAIVP